MLWTLCVSWIYPQTGISNLPQRVDLQVPRITKHFPKSSLDTGNNTWLMQTTLFFGISRRMIRDIQDMWRGGFPVWPGEEIGKSSLRKAAIKLNKIGKNSHVGTLHNNQRHITKWEMFRLEKHLWHSRPGAALVPQFPQFHQHQSRAQRKDQQLCCCGHGHPMWWMSREGPGSATLRLWLWFWQLIPG